MLTIRDQELTWHNSFFVKFIFEIILLNLFIDYFTNLAFVNQRHVNLLPFVTNFSSRTYFTFITQWLLTLISLVTEGSRDVAIYKIMFQIWETRELLVSFVICRRPCERQTGWFWSA